MLLLKKPYDIIFSSRSSSTKNPFGKYLSNTLTLLVALGFIIFDFLSAQSSLIFFLNKINIASSFAFSLPVL